MGPKKGEIARQDRGHESPGTSAGVRRRDNLDAPQLEVEQVKHESREIPGTWMVTWGIVNQSGETLELRNSHVPHGKFRGQRVDLSSLSPIAPGERQEIRLQVVFREEPGAKVENTFLILTVLWREKVWRVFVRMTVGSDSAGAPVARTELITVQEVGFSKEKP